MEEFFKQGDIEKKRGLEFSPLCDRQNTMVPQSQIGTDCPYNYSVVMISLFSGFIDYIVTPTMAVCGDMVSAVLGGSCEFEQPWNGTLVVNKERWQEKVED